MELRTISEPAEGVARAVVKLFRGCDRDSYDDNKDQSMVCIIILHAPKVNTILECQFTHKMFMATYSH
jgi:hypothetical protein